MPIPLQSMLYVVILLAIGSFPVHAGGDAGEFVTCVLTFSGDRLSVNFSTSVAGSLRVEFQNADGQPIPGFALADAPELFGDAIDQTYAWKSGADVASLADKPIRMRFVMKDADLYSLRFVNSSSDQ